MKVGIIGVGMVGGAMLQCFSEAGLQTIPYDKYRPGFNDEDVHFEALLECDIIFIAVPTPTSPNGTQDTSALFDALGRLSKYKYEGVVVSKCTTLPGTTRSMQNLFANLRIVHYPEFLTAANAYEDFKYQKAAMISGREENTEVVVGLLRGLFPQITIRVFLKYSATEIAKYTHNCFLAVKVSFMNEIYDVCGIHGVSYLEMIEAACLMGKIGETHTIVPGPDGARGWGGACFPKDTEAFLHQFQSQVVSLDTLNGAILSNKKRRQKK